MTKIGSGAVLEPFWGTPCAQGRSWRGDPQTQHRNDSLFGRLLGLTFVTFRCFCSSVFFLVFLRRSFDDFAATRVTKVAKKGAKMEPKAFPERLRDMCQKLAIYCTGSTSAPPGSVLKLDVSSNPFREAPGSPLEAHLCDSSTF